MKFLLEILGMTNQCNLRCSYCDWIKDDYIELNHENLANVDKYFKNIKKAIDEKFPELVMVEYSGGEPFMYPQIIDKLLSTFKEKWIRIISNGVLIKDEQIGSIKNHGKTFIAFSLDGHNLESNYPRLHNNNKLFDIVLNNIDKLIQNKIPVMILCTLNKYNINNFSEYISFLRERYRDEIELGMLVLPAHYVTNYNKDNGIPSKVEAEGLINYLNSENDNKIISNIKEYYSSLEYYIKNKDRKHKCTIPDWAISMHFRENQIIEKGKFLSFGCGMRGIKEFGTFDVNNDNEIKEYFNKANVKELSKVVTENVEAIEEDGVVKEKCEKFCFVDWVSFDLVLSGIVPIEQAEKWFVVFKDKKVKDFVTKFIESQKNKV